MNLDHLYNKLKMTSNLSIDKFNEYSTIVLFKYSKKKLK